MPRTPDFAVILAAATTAARAAARILRAAWRAPSIAVTTRYRHDIKLAADVKSEKEIIAILRAARPRDGFLAEESGAHNARMAGLWIVDPLDGTVNFSHRHPHFCTSIAWAWQGTVRVGVVYDPLRDEMFTATQGGGAFLNGSPVHVANTTDATRAMVAVGFGKVSPETTCLPDMTRLAGYVQKLRISGSAALDIAYTACGRYDAYYESQIYLWDICAASLILEEAGGLSYAWPGEQPHQVKCLSSVPSIMNPLLNHLFLDPAQKKPCTNLR